MKRALWVFSCCTLCGWLGVDADGPSSPLHKVPLSFSKDAMAASNSTIVPNPPPVALPSPTQDIDFSNSTGGSITDPEEIADQTMALSRQKQEMTEPDDADKIRMQRQIADDSDWMLRGYQEQLRKNGLVKTATESDPYGLQPPKTGSEAPDLLIDSLAPASVSVKKSEPSPSGEEKAVSEDSLTAVSLPPMLPPLQSNEPAPSPAHDYFGGPDSFDSSNSADTPVTTPPSGDTSILDVPGLTAARQDGLPDANLNVDDRLPDGPGETAPTNTEPNNFVLRQPPASDVDAFYKKQAISLQPAGVATFQAPVTLTAPKPYEEPPRIAKPAMDGLRNHVADPFDFLNR